MSVEFASTPWKLIPHPTIDNCTIFSLEGGPGLIAKQLTKLSWIGEKEFKHEVEMHVKAKELLPNSVPGVVGLFKNGDGEWIYVQEEVPGVELGKYNEDDIELVITQVVEKIKLLNKNGFEHGDLHGGNFIIDKDKKVWVIDFGLSSLTDKPRDDLLEVNKTLTVKVEDGTAVVSKGMPISNPLGHYLKTKKRVKILNKLNKSDEPRFRAIAAKYM